MTPKPLHEIRLRWGDHKDAIWWLALLYRGPWKFWRAIEGRALSQNIGIALNVMIHALPYIILICCIGRLILFWFFGVSTPRTQASLDALSFHGGQIAVGIGEGIVFGIAFAITIGIAEIIIKGITAGSIRAIPIRSAKGIAIGIAAGIAVGTGAGIFGAIAFRIAVGLGVAFILGIAIRTAIGIGGSAAGGSGVGIAVGIAAGIAVGIAVGVAGGPSVGIAVGIAVGITFLRCYYLVVHILFVWPRVRAGWYPFHPVAWDNCCSVTFPGLDRLLAAYTEQAPGPGNIEIERLIDQYRTQRTAALRARARLLAREAGRATDLTRLGETVVRLPEGTKGFLAETPRVVEMVGEIARLQALLNAMDRPAFREPYAEALCTAVENFQHRVAGFHEPLASEFREAADRWREVAARQRDEVRRVSGREPVTQVFRAGDPVDRDREAFVPRDRVVGRLEQQVMLATGCPGVVLYGRRRMGKSTVLRNLEGFLPPAVRTAVVSMQEAEAFTSLGSLCKLLGSRVRETWPGGAPEDGLPGDLPGLSRLLGDCDRALAGEWRRLILAVDEYENIDRKIGEGVFPEDLLALVRESIQSHRNLTWVFAGSHGIEELSAAPWASYLVSARTVEVPPFTEEETRLLLTEPLKHSTLWPRDRERPHFAPEFWGEGGIARVHNEAGGWPHLVQLIAETVVDLLNESDRRQVDVALWGPALDEAVVRGHNVFYQLLIGECRLAGEEDYLRGFRTRDAQPPPGDDAVARSLTRRQITVVEGDGWRLRAPLFQRWLQLRG
jgi:hypothetical protein